MATLKLNSLTASRIAIRVLNMEYRRSRPWIIQNKIGTKALTAHFEQGYNLKTNYTQQRYLRTSTTSTSEVNQAEATSKAEDPAYHSIIKDVESPKGQADKLEFHADTQKLLEIVAKSLYSEAEIFIRELISNASDSLEKFRYLSLAGENLERADRALEIHIRTDKMGRTFTIQDTGVGMTKEEMIANLGTIARSGSKAFLESLEGKEGVNNIIGQFGVGFYSCFMVSSHVDVYSCSGRPGSTGFKWSSDGTGSYEIQEADGVQQGTKIVIHLKTEYRQFSDDEIVKDVVKKYSNFVGSPIFLNGKQINTVEALWLKDPKQVQPNMHHDFYRFIAGAYDRPRFTLHFSTDVPLNVRCLLYIPDGKPGLFDTGESSQTGVSLYSRQVLIKPKADNIIPYWLRFLKGVVDSEDIPLNLSRELLQEGSLIKKLKTIVVNRVLKFLKEKSEKDFDEYIKFYNDYSIYLKEGIISEGEQSLKEDIAKLLRVETSLTPVEHATSLSDYVKSMQPAQKDIFYLAAPSRELADRSPYMESFKEKNIEVLYMYESYDEIVLQQLAQFNGKRFKSVETEMRETLEDLDLDALPPGSISKSEAQSLSLWLQQILKGRAHAVKFTKKLESHPCVVTVQEMSSARRFLKNPALKMGTEERYKILQPRLEVNIKHPIIRKLSELKDSNKDFAQALADYLFMNAMVEAGLEEGARVALAQANKVLLMSLTN